MMGKVNPHRIHIIFIIFTLWTLAIGLPNINFLPADWEFMQKELVSKRSALEILGQALIILLNISLAGLFCVFIWKILTNRKEKKEPAQEIYREPIKAPWFIYVFIVLLFGALGGGLWYFSRQAPFIEERIINHSHRDSSQEKAAQIFSEDSRPSKLEWTGFKESRIGQYFLISSLFIAMGWIILFWLIRRSPGRAGPEPNIPEIVARAVLDLEKGTDLTDVILRCYRDMCAIWQQKITLRPEMTAREFVQHLQDAGIRVEEVRRLTSLFEKVRYGRWVADAEERTEALSLLHTIRTQYGKVINNL